MNTPYVVGRMVNVRDIAGDICEMFEGLLESKDISIPDDDRTGEDGEARLYGMTYAECIDSLTELLTNVVKDVGIATGELIDIQDNFNGSMGHFEDYYNFN